MIKKTIGDHKRIIFNGNGYDDAWEKEAAKRGLLNLKGHKIAGGMRASIYNAMPVEGVRALVDYMKEFEIKNA